MNLKELFFLPVNASSHGHEIDMVIYLVHLLMFVLFVGWGAFFLFALVRFNRRLNPKADYWGVKNHTSTYLEAAVAIVEIVLLVGFSIPFWAKQVNALPNRKDIVEVRIVAEQFAWNIHYPGKDGVFGKTAPEFIDPQSNPIGLDAKDPSGKDDIVTINQLHLPIGRTAYIHLSTKDVIHSFFLPEMRVKQDVIPGMSIPAWFTPTMTGKFEIACAQLCGLGHYRMKGFLTIETEETYNQWLEEQAAYLSSDEDGENDFWN
jgi:cytochrome c oxidase subunit 2